jgi:hypothetical protein
VTSPYVFDASALIALFRSHEGVFDLFQEAEGTWSTRRGRCSGTW